jgi:ABC-2 type transport system ATP-binding protein
MTETPIVRLQGLSKQFGPVWALKEVDLSIDAGSIVGLLGPNGAGKTTLLGHLTGFLLPSSGRVEVFGRSAASLDDATLARLGHVGQEPRLLEWLTVAETIDFVRAGRPRWDGVLERRLLEVFELEATRKVGALSTGQRQRLAIVLAVAPRPDLLLLDEPAASLDPVARHDFLQLLMELIQEPGRTIIISSHVLADVEKVVDTVLMINAGEVHCHLPLDELREQYHRVDLRAIGGELPDPLPLPGLLATTGDRHQATAVCGHVAQEAVIAAAHRLEAEVQVRHLDFEEIYRLIAKTDGSRL